MATKEIETVKIFIYEVSHIKSLPKKWKKEKTHKINIAAQNGKTFTALGWIWLSPRIIQVLTAGIATVIIS